MLARILEKITGAESIYKSPTDMGVNRAGFSITDDAVVTEAAKQEVIRRYFRYGCEYAMGLADRETVERAEVLMKQLDVEPEDRKVVAPARQAATEAQQQDRGNEGVFCGAAIELTDGAIVTGRNSSLMHAASSLILNTIKHLAEMPRKLHLLSPRIIKSIADFKEDILNRRSLSLDLEETLIAISIEAAAHPAAKMAMEKLKEIRGCEVHMTHMPTPGDEAGLRRLGINLTAEANFSTRNLFVT